MDLGFGLTIQELRQATSQVLVLGQLAGFRNGDGWFDADDLARQFQDLRVPARFDIRRAVRQLVDTGMLVPRGTSQRWSVTPRGTQRVSELVGALDLAQLEPQLSVSSGAELGHALHTLIPPSLAPMKWAAGIKSLLERSPFETNVFCMTRYPDTDEEELPDPLLDVISAAREVLEHHGMVLHLASDQQIDDDLWGNVAAHAWACQYGLALVEDRSSEGINLNLIIELGSMLMTGRRCALLKDKSVPAMPTDFVGQIYKSADFSDVDSVRSQLHEWIARDLNLGICRYCPK